MNFYPLRPRCCECHADCHPHESKRDFVQWETNELCWDCNHYDFNQMVLEFRSMPR